MLCVCLSLLTSISSPKKIQPQNKQKTSRISELEALLKASEEDLSTNKDRLTELENKKEKAETLVLNLTNAITLIERNFKKIMASVDLLHSTNDDLNARNNRSDATKVTFLAKIKTTIQLLAIGTYLLGLVLNNMLIIIFGDIFLLIALIVTLYTGYIYTLSSLIKSKS